MGLWKALIDAVTSPLGFLAQLIVFLLLNILDAHSTFHVVSRSTLRSEKNPVARFFFGRFGLKRGMIVLKSVVVLIVPFMVYYYRHERENMTVTLSVANLFYALVVINNYRILRRLRKIAGGVRYPQGTENNPRIGG